jgi:ADP-ribose pyrophosphatase YjhB (NUDIX family)
MSTYESFLSNKAEKPYGNLTTKTYIRLYKDVIEMGYFKVISITDFSIVVQKYDLNANPDPKIIFTIREDEQNYKYKIIRNEYSVGIAAIHNNKILCVHQKKEPKGLNYSFPKGRPNKGESLKQTAVREVLEEIGIKFDEKLLREENLFDVRSFKGNELKTYYCFVVRLTEDEFRKILNFEVLPKENLQKEEIDWCGFLDKTTALQKLNPRYYFLTDLIN